MSKKDHQLLLILYEETAQIFTNSVGKDSLQIKYSTKYSPLKNKVSLKQFPPIDNLKISLLSK